ncbi:peptide ABC transporter substrate-binding protein [Facklamia sp. DSM 111018]|uniref:Peptide ABC transporter substrate-binding protein n=1 Tax=Facklamia lactis TaxID=2749967 RepID=A0ABS0LSH7_9LACT|nr:peptide ABC transporter substrate-binding protein [Facklamia lactis]MBG9980601.1 peptide ABC transporter substrate-binding protein [Facklamia lactis]MBG9986415.1 peptide ABC transporter substrate-binding protein [Facklamia lactis]
MKRSHKIIVGFLMMFLILSNFVGVISSISAQEGASLNLALNAEPPTLDPGLATDSTSGSIIRNVFEGLTHNNNGEIQPGVAEEWEESEDGLTWTFKLRQDATWSNGDPVTANDFVFSWKRVLDPATAATYASILYPIEGAEAFNTGEGKADDVGVKAIDDYTLEVKLTHPTPYFIELTSFYTYMPVNQKAVEADEQGWAAEAGDAYVTNGPFSLSEWNHNANVVLAKNAEYWDVDNVKLDNVNIQIIESEATANAEYQAGNLDYLGTPYGTVSLDSIDMYRNNSELKSEPYAAIYWYKINTTDEKLQNVNLRKALSLAIDRQALIDNILKGDQIPATGLIPPTIEGFEEDRGYLKDNDIELAKEYLATAMEELGIKDPSEITINISINESEAHSTIAQHIQQGWAQNLGINSEIDSTEWQVYLEKLQALDFQVGRMGWIADYNDASTFLDMYRTAKTGNNDTGWENENFKQLLDEAAAETDEAKRTQKLLDAEAVMMEEMPVIPIYYYTSNYVVKEGIEGLAPDALGNVSLKDVVKSAE